jgi:putative NADH-flavin reductase
MMNVLVFGPTGGTGRALVRQALDQGHQVTAFAHDPAAVTTRHPRLRVVQGDALDPTAVERAVGGHQAVLSALGGRPGVTDHLVSEGTRNIVKAMADAGVRRLVVQSGMHVAAFDGHPEDLTLPMRLLLPRLAKLRPLFQDKVVQEALLRDSGLDWVIVRAATLTDRPGTRTYRVGARLRLGMRSRIARADVAAFMLRALDDDTWLHQAPRISA